MIVLFTYMPISLTAVFVEESFKKALANIFKIGNRYFFKMLGTSILAFIPTFIATLIYSSSDLRSMSTMGIYSIGYWIFTILFALYGVCTTAFLNTYSMKQYLNEKDLYNQRIIPKGDSDTIVHEGDKSIEEIKE